MNGPEPPEIVKSKYIQSSPSESQTLDGTIPRSGTDPVVATTSRDITVTLVPAATEGQDSATVPESLTTTHNQECLDRNESQLGIAPQTSRKIISVDGNGDGDTEGKDDESEIERMKRILARQYYWRAVAGLCFLFGSGCLFLSMNLRETSRYQRRWTRR